MEDISQFAEGLSDRQAADAVRTRIDWKYVLCLELTDPGFHYSVLSEFRSRLLAGEAEQLMFEKLLEHFRNHGLLRARGQQRTDSTHVLGAIRALNRMELVGEAMRRALNALAVAHPAWMREHSQPHWIDRYQHRLEEARLPSSQAQRQVYTEEVGADGLALMTALWSSGAPSWLRELPAVQTLWRIWIQNFTWREPDRLRWRQNEELPPAALFINSPYDDARDPGRVLTAPIWERAGSSGRFRLVD